MEIGRINVGIAMEGVIPAREVQCVSENNVTTQEATEKNQNYKLEEIHKAVDKLNKFMEDEDIYTEYSVHDKLNQIMIKIIDRNTKEVLLEVPPKKILDMVAKMCEMVGILVDKKA
ncbi:flagellar protein FlaG [uncultured Clostridium sp.]|uniref:flagellar protein FlaG n=1 Tax=uncultured Clostridium sp. TaxID=59620 RepID=UPI0032162C29